MGQIVSDGVLAVEGNGSDGILDIEQLIFDAESEIAFANVQRSEIETGTVTVDEPTAFPHLVIEFKKHHNTAPFIAAIVDTTGTYDSTSNSTYSDIVWNFNEAFGSVVYEDSTTQLVATQHQVRRGTNTDRLSASTAYLHNRTPMIEAVLTNERYIPGSSSNYFRPGRVYKWVAVWM